ncbi:MAG: ECF-type sigma factor [Planctomycetota bacterium]
MDVDRNEARTGEITNALREMRSRAQVDADRVFALVEPELRWRVERECGRDHCSTLSQTTAIVHDAFLRLAQEQVCWKDRDHYFSVATLIVRRLLVDLARRERRAKRGGGRIRVALPADLVTATPDPGLVLDLDAAIERLRAMRPRWARLAELRVFGGLGNHEIAAVLGVALRTVEHDWHFVRAWLHRELS